MYIIFYHILILFVVWMHLLAPYIYMCVCVCMCVVWCERERQTDRHRDSCHIYDGFCYLFALNMIYFLIPWLVWKAVILSNNVGEKNKIRSRHRFCIYDNCFVFLWKFIIKDYKVENNTSWLKYREMEKLSSRIIFKNSIFRKY